MTGVQTCALPISVVMYGCESWTIRKAEHRGIDAFELWCWRRLLRDRKSVVEGNTDLFLKSQRLKLGGGGCGNRSSREAGDNIDVSLLHPKERNHMDDLDKPQAFSGH